MSHSHRDDHQLVDAEPVEPEPIIVPPPAPVLTNTEAERRAAERRKTEGIAESVLQHQFTGDIPEPSRGGTDTETRLVLTEGADDSAASADRAAPATRRGPPPPRFAHVDAEVSWVAPDGLDAASLPTTSAEWARDAAINAAALFHTERSWAR